MEQSSARRALLAVDAIFTGVILLILGYSFFFSPDENSYPVVCIHEKLTGEPCPSCGMSHAFSLIVRGRIEEAVKWNSASPGVFMFFLIQLFMRTGSAVLILKTGLNIRVISLADTVISSLMALVAFYPFLRAIWLTLLL